MFHKFFLQYERGGGRIKLTSAPGKTTFKEPNLITVKPMMSLRNPPSNHHQVVCSFKEEALIFSKVIYFIKTNLPKLNEQ